ncbi:MAG TPA: PDZ domain-containing protein [Polyangiaceae bacterium]|jgi:C-terminal processing protease CtpA/Prc
MKCLHVVSVALLALACAEPRGTIGAVIAEHPDGRLYLHEVPPDLAAGKAGLKAGDEILLIDGRDARAMSTAEVHEALSGAVGDRVKLTLLRGEAVIRVTLARTEARKLAGSGLR